ncbi:GNAT family N-acetyltransferase [Pelagibacterales bacterium SAG-MED07]|nr:GNAT family N-acetyltransferase [Pelagibacterales bacterium SAG-MED07]
MINLIDKIDRSNYILSEVEGVFTLKNENTTIGFVRFNEHGEIEYIFVNPLFRKKGFAKKLLKLVKEKTKKKIILQSPISPLGSKLLKSIEKWN